MRKKKNMLKEFKRFLGLTLPFDEFLNVMENDGIWGGSWESGN